MSIAIGLDIGGSNTKIAAVNMRRELLGYRVIDASVENIEGQVEDFVLSGGYNVDNIALTGAGSFRVGSLIMGQVPFKSNEFTAIGLGGQTLSGLDDIIVASMGTGTAFIHAKDSDYRHIIGTGIGGGTLLGLCQLVAGTSDLKMIEQLVENGSLGKVDLTVGEMTHGTLPSLNPELTASNFASIKADAGSPDMARGIMNLVLEAVGTMSILSAMAADTRDIVLTGALSQVSRSEEKYCQFSEIYGYNFIIPENAVCSTAIGAALDCIKQRTLLR